MSEEQKKEQEMPADEGAAGPQKGASSEVLDEIHSLGRQLMTAVQSLWDSDESRQLRQEIGQGFDELGRQLNSAVKSAQDSDAAKQFSSQVKETMDKARESDWAGQVEQGLVDGLRELNKHLAQAVDSLDAKPEAAAETEPEPESEPQDESAT